MELLKKLILFEVGYLMALMIIYVVGSKVPNYKYFTRKGKKMRVNMNLIYILIPAAVGIALLFVLGIIVLLNYDKFAW